MGAYTPRANLYKPGGGSTGTIVPDETADIDKLNANFDKLDTLLGVRNIPSASSYSGSMDGDLIFAQDTEYLHMYSANAGGLITPRLPGSRMFSGTAAQRTADLANRSEGDLWRDTNGPKLIWVKDGGVWAPAIRRWSGSLSDMNALTQVPEGFEWVDVGSGITYLRVGAVWAPRRQSGKVTSAPAVPAGSTAPAINVTFPVPFDVAPDVQITNQGNVRLTLAAVGITTTGFTLNLANWTSAGTGGSNDVSWLATR